MRILCPVAIFYPSSILNWICKIGFLILFHEESDFNNNIVVENKNIGRKHGKKYRPRIKVMTNVSTSVHK